MAKFEYYDRSPRDFRAKAELSECICHVDVQRDRLVMNRAIIMARSIAMIEWRKFEKSGGYLPGNLVSVEMCNNQSRYFHFLDESEAIAFRKAIEAIL